MGTRISGASFSVCRKTGPIRLQILPRDFPTLSDAQTIQKWWTLTLARFSALNRYQGLTPEETDAQLTASASV